MARTLGVAITDVPALYAEEGAARESCVGVRIHRRMSCLEGCSSQRSNPVRIYEPSRGEEDVGMVAKALKICAKRLSPLEQDCLQVFRLTRNLMSDSPCFRAVSFVECLVTGQFCSLQ
jgi:hypothetical protein